MQYFYNNIKNNEYSLTERMPGDNNLLIVKLLVKIRITPIITIVSSGNYQ